LKTGLILSALGYRTPVQVEEEYWRVIINL